MAVGFSLQLLFVTWAVRNTPYGPNWGLVLLSGFGFLMVLLGALQDRFGGPRP